MLLHITLAVFSVVFYKIFVNSLIVIQDITEKRAFSIEEVIGASLLISIAISALGDAGIFGLTIRNILSILIVMILGWKNGVLVGTTAGVTIGVTLGIIAQNEPIVVAVYAISGMLAGILNKFGRIGVIIGFFLGNAILLYGTNGTATDLVVFKEALIASLGLLAIPRWIGINIEELIRSDNMLPEFSKRGLEQNEEAINQLNMVSETIKDIANTYKTKSDTDMYFKNRQA
jgi:stage II sporulation protein E